MKNIFSRYLLARNTAALSVATTVLIRVILVARDKNAIKSLQEAGDYGKVYIYMGNQEKINTQVSERPGNENAGGSSHLSHPTLSLSWCLCPYTHSIHTPSCPLLNLTAYNLISKLQWYMALHLTPPSSNYYVFPSSLTANLPVSYKPSFRERQKIKK